MSVLTDVYRLAAGGATTSRIADDLGIDTGLAEAALDHWVRLGLVVRAGEVTGSACGTCAPDPGSIRCAGCPVAR